MTGEDQLVPDVSSAALPGAKEVALPKKIRWKKILRFIVTSFLVVAGVVLAVIAILLVELWLNPPLC